MKGMELGNGKKVNAEKLTYRGREKDGYPRGPVRKAAGCVEGYCANIIKNGGNPAFDSCDEVCSILVFCHAKSVF